MYSQRYFIKLRSSLSNYTESENVYLKRTEEHLKIQIYNNKCYKEYILDN